MTQHEENEITQQQAEAEKDESAKVKWGRCCYGHNYPLDDCFCAPVNQGGKEICPHEDCRPDGENGKLNFMTLIEQEVVARVVGCDNPAISMKKLVWSQMNGCYFVYPNGMVVGIEVDGYMHS